MVPRDPRQDSLFDLSDRAKFRVTGADRIRFVNGQITNDVRKATDRTAIAACLLNVKGKMNAHVVVSLRDDSILIDTDAQLGEVLGTRLERYIISDDVQIEDVTNQFSMFHVLAGTVPTLAESSVSVARFRQPGWDLWVEAAQHDEMAQTLSDRLPLCDPACAEVFRIEQGIPAWGRELTEDTIPVEANLEESCIDYEKGCYIGQEIISRMRMSRQRNKGLYGLIAASGVSLSAGMKLHPADDEQKEAGWITSATHSDRLGKNIALGYVKRPFDRAGSQLLAGIGIAEIVNLPFDIPIGKH